MDLRTQPLRIVTCVLTYPSLQARVRVTVRSLLWRCPVMLTVFDFFRQWCQEQCAEAEAELRADG